MKKISAEIVLPDIRSAHNVGSIFRTADALGIQKIYLAGYTPTPLDRFNRPQKEIAKTALGAELTIPWEYHKSAGTLLKKLKAQEKTIIAIEQSENSLDYKKVKVSGGVVFVVGNEVDGLSPALLKYADVIAEIPMRGEKESLNVAVSAGVAMFRILNV